MIGNEVYCAPEAQPTAPGQPPAPAPAPVQIVVTQQELQNMPIDPGGLSVQPDAPWVLINIETIVYTGAQEQIFDTVLLDTPVRVRATPIKYRWEFGEGPAVTTTDQGRPYPNQTIWHEYEMPTAEGEARQVTLTTVWEGAFSVDGGQWQLIYGTATTTQMSNPFEVREARSSLILGPEDRA